MNEVGHVWTAKQLKSPGSIFAFTTVAPMDPGSGTEENFEGPIELEPAPIATLGPVPPPGVNMAGTGVLRLTRCRNSGTTARKPRATAVTLAR